MLEFTLTSNSFKTGELISNHYAYNGLGCQGDNISPALEWQGAPSETKSYAITVFDPDAPTNHGWWHWTVVNIPSYINHLEEGASNRGELPLGAIEAMTDYRKTNYGGPCPPKGTTHRYVFTIYALNTDKVDVRSNFSGNSVEEKLKENSIAQASLTVKYGR